MYIERGKWSSYTLQDFSLVCDTLHALECPYAILTKHYTYTYSK